MRFSISYNSFNRCLLIPLGMGPKRSQVALADEVLTVRMGWAFLARVPLRNIRSAAMSTGPVLGWGVHGWRGRWLVNGSSQGIVTVTIDPPVSAHVLGFGITLRELSVSLEQPDEFIAACTPVPG